MTQAPPTGGETAHTSVTAYLDARQIAYRRVPLAGPVHTASAAAEEGGTTLAQIVKTMVLADRDGQPVLALVPGDQRLDVKAVARVVGRPLKIMPLHRIPQATGFEVGAVAPFGLPGGPHPVVADRAIFRHPSVDISSGRHDLGLRLSSADLLALLGGAAHPITAP